MWVGFDYQTNSKCFHFVLHHVMLRFWESTHQTGQMHKTTVMASRECDVILKDFPCNVNVAFFSRMLACSALIGHRSDFCCHWLTGVAPVTASVRAVTSHPVSVLGLYRCIALLWLADTTVCCLLVDIYSPVLSLAEMFLTCWNKNNLH